MRPVKEGLPHIATFGVFLFGALLPVAATNDNDVYCYLCFALLFVFCIVSFVGGIRARIDSPKALIKYSLGADGTVSIWWVLLAFEVYQLFFPTKVYNTGM